jgi:two-component system chemotaxis sensor kinase CheA
MGTKEEELLKRLLQVFNLEAEERLNALSSGLVQLEGASTPEDQAAAIERLFRETHNLKGASRTVNKLEVEAVCQAMEDVFDRLRQQQMSLSPPLFDLLHNAVDLVAHLLAEPGTRNGSQVPEIVEQLNRFIAGEITLEVTPPPSLPSLPIEESLPPPPIEIPQVVEEALPPAPLPEKAVAPPLPGQPLGAKLPASNTIRISTTKLDSLLFQVEEMLSVKLTVQQHALDLRTVTAMFELGRKAWGKVAQEAGQIRQALDSPSALVALDENGQAQLYSSLNKLLTFLEWQQSHIGALEHKLETLSKLAENDQRQLGGMVDNLLEEMKKALTLPCSSLLDVFPKMVRDIARTQGKQVSLVVQGGEVEIDRRILEEMKDALTHLIRNCLDHGIELPEERLKKNKPAQATITLAVSQMVGGKVEILISDDGGGIDVERVKAAALKQGVLSPQELAQLTEEEAIMLIFQSAVSTSPIVTDLSGRGLGMAIVREKVEKLGGKISVETVRHVGSIFRIQLPLTLATFRGVLVEAAGQTFVIPTSHVERVVRIARQNIQTVQNKETISLNGRVLPLISLAEALELPASRTETLPFVSVIILNTSDKTVAFQVETVLREQEVLVKSLGKQLIRVRNVAAATVLGSGQVAPILNVSDLIKSALKLAGLGRRAIIPAEKAEPKQQSILVVEDSITSRMLLKNILEGAGYQVQTAIDGVEAFTALRETDFDLVVSDIEMPRLNGFDLTLKIRNDEKLSHLPLVLVTSLTDQKDRERGIEVGADAYIVKSSFDQSNLLEVIRQLI